MSRRSNKQRSTWNGIKAKYSKGTTLGVRQMFALSCRIAYDYEGRNGSYNDNVFRGVDQSLVKRGLLEPYICNTFVFDTVVEPFTQISWHTRITEKGLKEFIHNDGDKIDMEAIKGLLIRTGWIHHQEWMKYLTLGYLPA